MRHSLHRLLVFVALVLSLGPLALGCASETATSTTAPSQDGNNTVTTASGAAPVPGAVLAVAIEPFKDLDPAWLASTGDVFLARQVYERLVEQEASGGLVPGLALSWEHSGATAWTFELRSDVLFHDGEEFDANDVVHTFERLRDLAKSAPALSGFDNIESVTALDPAQVKFVLLHPDPEFPALLASDPAAVLSEKVSDPVHEWVGTGPFALWSYVPAQGAVLKRHVDYWRRDAAGRRLPYLDGVDLVFSRDSGTRLGELLSGRVGFVGGLTAKEVTQVRASPGLFAAERPSNDHFAIHVQSDAGHLGADVRVRQALKLATDREALIRAARPGLAVPGADTPFGPLYDDMRSDVDPPFDPAAATGLLVEAGFPSGLSGELLVEDEPEALLVAEEWTRQMAEIGVLLEVKSVASGPYQSDGDASWLSAEFWVTRWSTEVSPRAYLRSVYSPVAPMSGTWWDDEEFRTVLADLAVEGDEARRRELYLAVERILRERGPVVVPFFMTTAVGLDRRVQGLELAPYWPRTTLRAVSFAS
ncbi:MAG: hypothetical protein KKA32_04440 [Actinobacteria bacterium]|nr:hypothetical protein [Actinomycetota bacterium]